MFGDGSTRRDYTFCTDIVQGIAEAIEKDFGFEVFNLGGGRTVELRRLISLIEEALGMKARIRRRPTQAADMAATDADIAKSRRLLGYEPKVSIEEGVPIFVKWFLETMRKTNRC